MSFSIFPKRVCFIILPALFLTASCADLSHINSFCTEATRTLTAYDSIGYGYVYSYQAYTVTKDVYLFNQKNLDSNELAIPKLFVPGDTAAYSLAVRADKAVTILYNCIGAYFKGMSKLSDKGLANYQWDSLTLGLKSDTAALNRINLTDTGAINTIAGIGAAVSHFIAARYQQKKLRQLIIQYDPAVDRALFTLSAVLKELINTIESDKDLVKVKYERLLNVKYFSLDAKIGWIREYTEEAQRLERKKLALSQLCQALETIAGFHKDLAQKLANEQLSDKEITKLLDKDVAAIKLSLQQITTIKP